MTVTVKKLGGSVAVVIPKAVARELGLSEGMPLDVSTGASSIILRKQGRRPRRPLSEIVAQMKSSRRRPQHRELIDDPPVGKEIW